MDKRTKGIIGILVGVIVILVIIMCVAITGMKRPAVSHEVKEIEQEVVEDNSLDDIETKDSLPQDDINSEQVVIQDVADWSDFPETNDAIAGNDIVTLLPLLDAIIVDGKHISEWNVDSLIAKNGLYLTNGKYQNEKQSDEDFEEAKVEDNDKIFTWNKVSHKTGIKYSFEFHENYSDLSNCTYYTLVMLINSSNGDNPWAKNGITEFAIDNGITDSKGFLKFLGVSDSVSDSILNDGIKYIFVTDCPGDVMIPAIISCDWNGVKVRADELTIIYHEDIGRLELTYDDETFWEWR